MMNGIMMGLSPREARKRYESVIEFAELQRVPGPEDQELLVGHAGPPGVLGRDPGRRGHPADRRGARRRRRLVPAEVLRRLPRPCAIRARRSCSSPTTWARCSASATGRCCWSGARWSTSASRPRWRSATWRSTSAATVDGRGDRGSARRRRRCPGGRGVGRERGRASAPRRSAKASASRCACWWRSWSTSRTRRPSVHVHNEEQKAVLVAAHLSLEHEHSGRFPAGERALFSFAFDNVLAPGRYSPVINLAASWLGPGRHRPYESGFSFLVTGQAAAGRDRRPAHRGGHPARGRRCVAQEIKRISA